MYRESVEAGDYFRQSGDDEVHYVDGATLQRIVHGWLGKGTARKQ